MICPAKCLLVWAVALTSSLAQSPAPHKQFEVAAVKLNTSDDRHFEFHNLPGGTLKATGVTLKMLLMQVYGLQSYQVSGGPGCITMARWDIRAQAEGEPGRSETREAPVYALLAAKNGPKLNPAAGGSPRVQMRPASKFALGAGAWAGQSGSIWASAGSIGRATLHRHGRSFDFHRSAGTTRSESGAAKGPGRYPGHRSRRKSLR